MQAIDMTPIVQGNTAVLYGRIEDLDGTPLVQADVSAISVKCYDMGDRSNAVGSETPNVSDVIFNTLQPWPDLPGFTAPDSEGYNVRYETPATFFPQGNRNYQVEMICTVGGKPRSQIWRQSTIDLFQS